MPRYWVIAPVESKNSELFDKVWQFDLANNLISIGWHELGNVSSMSRDEISDAVSRTYPDKPPQTISLIVNMLWAFYHEIEIGDMVVARRGRKTLAGIGKVVRSGFFSPAKNPFLAASDYSHTNFLGVEWQEKPRNKGFADLVFPVHTLNEATDAQYLDWTEGSGTETDDLGIIEKVDQNTFVLEKYLEEFIVSNFDTIFKRRLRIYKDAEGEIGQQFTTDIGSIDILAVEPASNSFVVIELKKGRPSDQVVGQVLRYMGWVKKNLCGADQAVKGLVICRDPDPKLSYAIDMIKDVNVQYYSVSFALSDDSKR